MLKAIQCFFVFIIVPLMLGLLVTKFRKQKQKQKEETKHP